jgi:sugar phosphate permease
MAGLSLPPLDAGGHSHFSAVLALSCRSAPAGLALRPGEMRNATDIGGPHPMSAEDTPKRHLHYAWTMLVMGTLVVLGALGLARFGYSMVLPAMQQGLGMDSTQAGMLATANLLGYVALAAVGGALASRLGPRAVISAGLAVAGLGMLLTGLAHGFPEALVWRALTGVGSGASNVPVMGLMVGWFAAGRRGLAAGVAAAGSSVALILLGSMVPPILAAGGGNGWRTCWFGFGAVALLLALLSALLLRNRPGDLGLHPLGASLDETSTAPAAPQPLRWSAVYRAPAVWHLGLVYVAFGFSYIIYMTFFVKGLVSDGGYSPQAAGSLFLLMGWCSLLCGVIWGSVSDRIGRKRGLIIVYLIQGAAFALFALWPRPVGFTLSAVLFGLTAWSIPAIMAAACADMMGTRMAPAALGFITLFFGLGQALGPAVAGIMADATGSFGSAMLLAAGVAALGAVGAALLRSAGLLRQAGR